VRCLYCGKEIWLVFLDRDFCCARHRRSYHRGLKRAFAQLPKNDSGPPAAIAGHRVTPPPAVRSADRPRALEIFASPPVPLCSRITARLAPGAVAGAQFFPLPAVSPAPAAAAAPFAGAPEALLEGRGVALQFAPAVRAQPAVAGFPPAVPAPVSPAGAECIGPAVRWIWPAPPSSAPRLETQAAALTPPADGTFRSHSPAACAPSVAPQPIAAADWRRPEPRPVAVALPPAALAADGVEYARPATPAAAPSPAGGKLAPAAHAAEPVGLSARAALPAFTQQQQPWIHPFSPAAPVAAWGGAARMESRPILREVWPPVIPPVVAALAIPELPPDAAAARLSHACAGIELPAQVLGALPSCAAAGARRQRFPALPAPGAGGLLTLELQAPAALRAPQIAARERCDANLEPLSYEVFRAVTAAGWIPPASARAEVEYRPAPRARQRLAPPVAMAAAPLRSPGPPSEPCFERDPVAHAPRAARLPALGVACARLTPAGMMGPVHPDFSWQGGRSKPTGAAQRTPAPRLSLPELNLRPWPPDLQEVIRHDWLQRLGRPRVTPMPPPETGRRRTQAPPRAPRPPLAVARHWKGIAASIVLAAALWFGGSLWQGGSLAAANDWARQAIRNRAALELDDNFRGGLQRWAGGRNWAQSWTHDPAGYMRTGQLALYQPSLKLTDYRLEFFAQIERQSLGWVVRARDTQNYYAMKFTIMEPGPRPMLSVVRYPVIGGKKGIRVQVPIRAMIHNDRPYRVQVDVKGNRFSTLVEGQVVDTWSDDTLPAGGVGFFSEAGERARLYWMKVSSNTDVLGRVCGALAASRLPAAGHEFAKIGGTWNEPEELEKPGAGPFAEAPRRLRGRRSDERQAGEARQPVALQSRLPAPGRQAGGGRQRT
jgi:hypothetical protein